MPKMSKQQNYEIYLDEMEEEMKATVMITIIP